MTTTCKWYPVAAAQVPQELLAGDNKFNYDAFTSGDAAVAAVGSDAFSKIQDAVVADLKSGKVSDSDAHAYYNAAKIYVATIGGDRYALVDASKIDYAAGWMGLYKLSCGDASKIFAKAPMMVVGAGVLAFVGYFVGSKWSKGKKGGVGPLVGAAAGAALGACAGALASNLTTPSAYKGVTGLGASRRRHLR